MTVNNKLIGCKMIKTNKMIFGIDMNLSLKFGQHNNRINKCIINLTRLSRKTFISDGVFALSEPRMSKSLFGCRSLLRINLEKPPDKVHKVFIFAAHSLL